jgi:hypothetical protein
MQELKTQYLSSSQKFKTSWVLRKAFILYINATIEFVLAAWGTEVFKSGVAVFQHVPEVTFSSYFCHSFFITCFVLKAVFCDIRMTCISADVCCLLCWVLPIVHDSIWENNDGLPYVSMIVLIKTPPHWSLPFSTCVCKSAKSDC